MKKNNKKATLIIEDIFITEILEKKLSSNNNENLSNLIKAYRESIDKEQKEKIFQKILSYFEKFITKMKSKYKTFDPEDITSIASLSILKAIQNYQEDKGDIKNFIICYIEKEIKNYILKQDIIKTPKTIRKLYFQINKYINENPNTKIQELSKIFNLTEESIEIILNLSQKTNQDLSKIKSLKLTDLSLPIEDKIFLEQILKNLSEIEKKIIELLFQDITKIDIMKQLNISKKIFYSILNKIKQKINNMK
jgi:RNA polymerase sigma factor (sigma-70 family)